MGFIHYLQNYKKAKAPFVAPLPFLYNTTNNADYPISESNRRTQAHTKSEEEYYGEDTCLKKIGRTMRYNGADAHANSFPYHFAYQAGLYYLEQWVRTGEAPITTEPISVMGDTNAKDADGNSIGGWRLPQIELPVCAYYGTSTASKIPGDTFTPVVYGREEPFPAEVLKERYESLAHYNELLIRKTDECIEKGLLLPADRDEAIERASINAAEYGLI